MLLQARAVSKSFGPKEVLRSVNIKIEKGDRIGLIGRNGVGKTTMLKILMGQIRPDTGEISINTNRIGYLSQRPELDGNMKVSQLVGIPYGQLAAIANKISELEDQITTKSVSGTIGKDQNKVAAEYARLQEEFGSAGGFGIEARAKDALKKVGCSKDIIDRTISTLSGGEMTKVLLARIILQAEDVDIIFLDEPTSHLDMETVEWLENYLLKLDVSLVIISHDRYFLENIVTSIVELEAGMAQDYSGNYSAFLEKKAMEVERKQKTYEKYKTEAERQRRIADEQHQRWTYFSLHKTRLKMMEHQKKVEAPTKSQELTIKLEAADKSGKNMLIATDLTVNRGGKNIIENANLEIDVGDKLGIIGPNGSGKTSLVKALRREIEFDGKLWLAPGASVGYFAQEHDNLDNALSAEKQLLSVLDENQLLKARTILGRFLISGKDAKRPIGTLSGGERARVALALLIAERRNFLIMDEPTNYLDIPSRHAVENALVEYPGTFLIITHDRYLLDTVCNKIGELKDGELSIFAGNYSEMKKYKRKIHKFVETDEYIVVSGFKDWATGKKYNVDEILTIPEELLGHFSWALDTGRLKRKGS